MTQPADGLDLDGLVEEISAGSRGFHRIPSGLSADDAATVRRRGLEAATGVTLDGIGHYSLDAEQASTRHCENFIGVAQVPMGIVGPISVRGRVFQGECHAPMATTEGALLASVNRGCRAIQRAGGAVVLVEDVGMTRAPVFRAKDAADAARFREWIEDNFEEIRTRMEATSRYLKLLELQPAVIASTVFLRFRFATGDAMGMNMATIACDRVIREFITPESGVSCIALSGNFCVDKKPAAVNFIQGRGKRVQSEVHLSKEILAEVLKCRADQLLEVQYRKNLLGSIAAGSMGYNSHAANVLAAFYIATGQDPAHVVEGSMAITTIESDGADGVRFGVHLPAVPVGAVGGGTGLKTQREALDVVGIRVDPERPGKAAIHLAEIVGALVLAGELSLMSALASSDLAGAHERLGRGGPPGP